MRAFRQTTIKRKLIGLIMLTSSVALIVAFALMIASDYVSFRSGIVRGGEQIGTIYLQSTLQEMNARLSRYSEIGGAIVLGASLIAFLFSSRLQRVISEPILSLAHTARIVSEQKNYSVRAEKRTGDEIGFLIDRFNEMLAQIEEHE